MTKDPYRPSATPSLTEVTAHDDVLLSILQRTYDEHALGARAWGINPEQEKAGGCSYAAGCSIGLSLKPKTAARIDDSFDPADYNIDDILNLDAYLRRELFGTVEALPERCGLFLSQLQFEHDQAAIEEGKTGVSQRARYKDRLISLAEHWGLRLRGRP